MAGELGSSDIKRRRTYVPDTEFENPLNVVVIEFFPPDHDAGATLVDDSVPDGLLNVPPVPDPEGLLTIHQAYESVLYVGPPALVEPAASISSYASPCRFTDVVPTFIFRLVEYMVAPAGGAPAAIVPDVYVV